MNVTIVCRDLPGGWLPDDVERGLGGSEEGIVCFAEALARAGSTVRVHHPRPPDAGDAQVRNGVSWQPRSRFDPRRRHDVLISYREPALWHTQQQCRVGLHWSVDVETPWHPAAVAQLSAYVCLSHWGLARQVWVPQPLARVIPYGVDLDLLDAHPCEPEPHTWLYCSSYDRGLETLLADWPRIREHEPETRLRVAYGWGTFDRYRGQTEEGRAFKRRIEAGLRQAGITHLGHIDPCELAREYWRASVWVHPLNRPDSEMFCLNAVKARYCGAVPLIIAEGALKETASTHLDYRHFVATGEYRERCSGWPPAPTRRWDDVVAQYWMPLLTAEPAREGAA